MKMNGIKLGQGYLRSAREFSASQPETPIYTLLADHGINTEFLQMVTAAESCYLSCCLAPDVQETAQGLAMPQPDRVSLMSVYPHRSSLKILASFISLLTREGIRFSDILTSGSMLTAVVDSNDQARIETGFIPHVDLPDSHTPFSQQLSSDDKDLIRKNWPETSAAYEEAKIKTYGIMVRDRLTLFSLHIGPSMVEKIASELAQAVSSSDTFSFSAAHTTLQGHLDWSFLCADPDGKIRTFLSDGLPARASGSTDIRTEMALVSIQGPHYGDRYGIANRTLCALANADIPVRIAGFTGACIFLVMDQDQTGPAEKSLAEVFEKP